MRVFGTYHCIVVFSGDTSSVPHRGQAFDRCAIVKIMLMLILIPLRRECSSGNFRSRSFPVQTSSKAYLRLQTMSWPFRPWNRSSSKE